MENNLKNIQKLLKTSKVQILLYFFKLTFSFSPQSSPKRGNEKEKSHSSNAAQPQKRKT